MSTSPVRIGIVGLDHWYWAFSFAGAAVTSQDVELVAIADADAGRAKDAADRFGVGRATARAQELIEDPQIDAIASFISVDQNPAICVQAARAGKHIFSVKPLARTLAEATEILDAVRAAGVLFLPAESANRLAAQPQQIKQWIGEGRLGRVISASYSQHAGLPQRWPGDADSGWFLDPARTPGGGWIDHSIYHIDLLRWLLGDEVAEVSGRAAKLKYPDLPVEDYGDALLLFRGGAVARIEDTWLAPPCGGRSSMSLVGTEGAVAWDGLSGRLSVAGEFPPFEGWVHTAPKGMHEGGLDHLVALARGEAEPVASVEDAWRNLAACLAFYEAAEAGRAVAPQEPPSA